MSFCVSVYLPTNGDNCTSTQQALMDSVPAPTELLALFAVGRRPAALFVEHLDKRMLQK